MYYVYVLKSLKDHKLYVGQTNNIENRLQRHNKGQVKSTRNRTPFEILFYEEFDSRAEALRHEKYLKSGAGHEYIKQKLVHPINLLK